MSVLKRFDSPLKRLNFIVMLMGLAVLTISLIVWTQQSRHNSIYYSKDHYGWIPANQVASGRTEKFWSLDRACALPYAQKRLAETKQNLKVHSATEPEQPKIDFIGRAGLEELRRHTEQSRVIRNGHP